MENAVEKILRILQYQAEGTVHMLDLLFSSPSILRKKLNRSFLYGPPKFETDWSKWYREKQKIYSVLNQLKRDGLIIKKREGRASCWRITRRGLQRLARRDRQKTKAIPPLPRREYTQQKGDDIVIFSFDVPEKDRRKRRWLRTQLAGIGFSPLHKSVWIGKSGMPEDFIDDLRFLRMMSYLHIFTVNKRGTIVKVS